MKNMNSTLKKWNSKLRNPKFESTWKKWISIKQHSLKEFMQLINSDADDFFKMRALLFLIVPGYWRPRFDADKNYMPEYQTDFSIDSSKISKEVRDFSIELLTVALSEVRKRFIESLADPVAISIAKHDVNITTLQRREDTPIYSLKKIDEGHYKGDYYYFGRHSLATCNAIAGSLLNIADKEQGQELFENLFFASKPIILLYEMHEPIYIENIGDEIQIFIEKATTVTWVKKLGRFFFEQYLLEKDKDRRNQILSLYTKGVIGAVNSLKVSQKEKESFYEEEVSFLLENTLTELWKENDAFNFGFRNFHYGNNWDPVSENLKLLITKNPALLVQLLRRMIISRMRITGGSIKVAELIVKNTTDEVVKEFFKNLISEYHSHNTQVKTNERENASKEQEKNLSIKQTNQKSKELLSKMMGS